MSSRTKWYWLIALIIIACYLIGIILVTGEDLNLHSTAIDNLVKPALSKEETEALVSRMIEDAKSELEASILSSQAFKDAVSQAVAGHKDQLSQELYNKIMAKVIENNQDIIDSLLEPETSFMKDRQAFQKQIEDKLKTSLDAKDELYQKLYDELLGLSSSYKKEVLDEVLLMEPEIIQKVEQALEPVSIDDMLEDVKFANAVLLCLLDNKDDIVEAIRPYISKIVQESLDKDNAEQYQRMREDIIKDMLGGVEPDETN